MRKAILLAVALLFVLPGRGAWWRSPDSLASGAEAARREVLPFASRDEALAMRRTASRYVQPIAEWEQQPLPEGVRYRTPFTVPFSWVDRRAILHLGRVGSAYEVEVNGRRAGYTQNGQSPTEFDLTPLVREGLNELVVTLRPGLSGELLEDGPARAAKAAPFEDAFLLSQPPVRVRDLTVSTAVEGRSGLLSAGVVLKSHRLNAKQYRVYYELLSPAGERVASGFRELPLDMRREDTVRFLATIRDVLPWSHESPYLYTFLVWTQYEGRFREWLAFPVGFRAVKQREGRLEVNGAPVTLHTARMGEVADSSELVTELVRLKSSGYNAVEVDGRPRERLFYTICDRLGLYVIDTAPVDTRQSDPSRRVGGNPSNDPRWEEAYLDRARRMWDASKNHPSVVAFRIAGEAAQGYNLYESYRLLKSLEPERPVLYDAAGGEWNTDRLERTYAPAPVEPAAVFVRDGDGYRVVSRLEIAPLEGVVRVTVYGGRSKRGEGELPVCLAPGGSVPVPVSTERVRAGQPYRVEMELLVEFPSFRYEPDRVGSAPVPSLPEGKERIARAVFEEVK